MACIWFCNASSGKEGNATPAISLSVIDSKVFRPNRCPRERQKQNGTRCHRSQSACRIWGLALQRQTSRISSNDTWRRHTTRQNSPAHSGWCLTFHIDTKNKSFPRGLKTGLVSEACPLNRTAEQMTRISFVRRRRAPIEKPDGTAASAGESRRLMLVLGMHRSGTSLPLLMSCTCWAPEFQTHLRNRRTVGTRAVIGNRCVSTPPLRNFFVAMAPCWFDLSAIPADAHRQPHMRPHYEAIRTLVDEETRGPGLWVVKNPRNCRLVHFGVIWSPISAPSPSPSYLFAIRSPWPGSLARRDGFSAARSCLLWLRHVVDAEFETRCWPRVFIDDAVLLSDWRRALRPLAELGCYDAKRLTGPLGPLVDATIKVQLRHGSGNQYDARILPEPQQWFSDVYEACLELANAGARGGTDARFDQVRSAFASGAEAMAENTKQVAAYLLQENGQKPVSVAPEKAGS